MFNKNSQRQSPAVNAGSMADIAFLLLIFFLVTTTIEIDKGILAKLPPWTDEPIDQTIIADNRVFTVKINATNQLLVENREMTMANLRASAKEFIANPMQKETMPRSPKDAVVSLQNDRGTAYETYLLVYNELKGAYNELREEAAQQQFGMAFQKLNKADQNAIKKQYPMVISEAEPTEHEAQK